MVAEEAHLLNRTTPGAEDLEAERNCGRSARAATATRGEKETDIMELWYTEMGKKSDGEGTDVVAAARGREAHL